MMRRTRTIGAHLEKLYVDAFSAAIFCALLTSLLAFSANGDGVPTPGMQTYTLSHAKHENPPDRLGGPLTVRATQETGMAYFALPGPRELDPAVFNTPKEPVGFDPAPDTLLGVPPDLRKTYNGAYSVTAKATPFNNWVEVTEDATVDFAATDQTAIDGATTKDTIDFDAEFNGPDGTRYRVTCSKPIPHGLAYPFFGGVVTNHILHGASGIGTRLMPTEFSYAAFWGTGDVYRNGEKIAEGQLVHVMITEFVRGQGYDLELDGGVGEPPQGMTMHLMVPPFKPGPNGLENAPLKTGFDPLPYVQKHLDRDTRAAEALPADARKARMAELDQIKSIMKTTQQRVEKETKAGTMDGQPFFHVMFNDFTIEAGN